MDLQVSSPFYHLRMRFVDQRVAISCLAGVHIHDGLISFLQRTRLDPRLDILFDRKRKHLVDFMWSADGRTTYLATLGY